MSALVTLASSLSNDPHCNRNQRPVVVDNRAGMGGIPGSDIVAKANPDGYTILINSTTA